MVPLFIMYYYYSEEIKTQTENEKWLKRNGINKEKSWDRERIENESDNRDTVKREIIKRGNEEI